LITLINIKTYRKTWQLIAFSYPWLVEGELWVSKSISFSIWCIVSSSFSPTWTQFVDIMWLEAIECEYLLRLITMFLSVLHSASNSSILFFFYTRVFVIIVVCEVHWCSFSWTLEVIEKREYLLHWIDSVCLLNTLLNSCAFL
jgi:hypothetical protein